MQFTLPFAMYRHKPRNEEKRERERLCKFKGYMAINISTTKNKQKNQKNKRKYNSLKQLITTVESKCCRPIKINWLLNLVRSKKFLLFIVFSSEWNIICQGTCALHSPTVQSTCCRLIKISFRNESSSGNIGKARLGVSTCCQGIYFGKANLDVVVYKEYR